MSTRQLRHHARGIAGMTALAAFSMALAGMAAFLAGTLSGVDWLRVAGGWLTVPLTLLLGGLVAAAVVGYALVAAITVWAYLLRAARRCTRG